MIKAKLINPTDMCSPSVEVSFPITNYGNIYQSLAASGMGSPTKRDCRIAEIGGPFEALSALLGQDVNVDELDYLAKRLDSFMSPEAQQFQGMAVVRGLRSIEDFINLTFCCQQATVISDFSDLRAIGRTHYMNKNGGSASISELDALDAVQEARTLIQDYAGITTPYGVVYENGMDLEQLYKGREFPGYLYDPCVLEVELTRKSEPDVEGTWLYLPMPEVCIKRALERGGLENPDTRSLTYAMLMLPFDVFCRIDMAAETLGDINKAAAAILQLDNSDADKLCAIAAYIEPGSASALNKLVEKLGQFDFYPGVSTPEGYGRHMIAESGHFLYDAELDEFYNFAAYGNSRLKHEHGAFVDSGYICYNGEVPLEVLFPESERLPSQGIGMGSM